MFAEFGLRGAARLWYAKTLADGGSIPYARDIPHAAAGEGPADHVLLIGNGAAHGWGVSSHQLALCGQLATALFGATGHATEVEYVGAELMNAESALAWLGDHDLSGYDAVVVVMGMNDAVRLTPIAAWQRHLTALLDHLRSGLRHGAPIVVSSIQPVASVLPYRGFLAAVGQRRAAGITLATRAIVDATPGTAFAALGEPMLEAGRPHGSAATYRAWADELAAVAAPLLDEHRSRAAGRRRSKVEARQWRWAGAPALLHAAGERGTPELRRLVNAAKVEFGVTLAVVTLLEGDRMWFAAASADTPVAIPVSLSYDQHVPADGPMVVPDAGSDERFKRNPFISQSHLPFYAGHPIHDLQGRMIGTFCVLAARPRPAASVRLDLLREYAAQAEREVQQLEAEAVGAVSR
jgi:lysophospholipase L1-like esterase